MAEETQVATEQVPLDNPQVSMREFTEAREKGVSTIEKPIIPSEPLEEQEGKREEGVEEQPEGEESKPDEKQPRKRDRNAEKRISEVVAQREAEKAEKLAAIKKAEAAEKRAQEYERRHGPLPSEDEPPKREQFNNDEEFWRADGVYNFQQNQKVQQQLKAQTELTESFNREIEETRQIYSDFDKVTKDVRLPWNPSTPAGNAQQEAFLDARNSAGPGMIGKLIYYYGANQNELEALRNLSPTRIDMEVGYIAKELAKEAAETDDDPAEGVEKEEVKEKPKIVSKAPAPIKPVGGSGTKSTIPLDKMPMADYEKARAAGRIR
jgi:hypothetical protein